MTCCAPGLRLSDGVSGDGTLGRGVRQYELRLALDAFGTGYASLAEIERLPLDRIKIGCPSLPS